VAGLYRNQWRFLLEYTVLLRKRGQRLLTWCAQPCFISSVRMYCTDVCRYHGWMHG